jgi:hypothetical protein
MVDVKKLTVVNVIMALAILFSGLFLTGCPHHSKETTQPTEDTDPLAGNLLILQAYGNGPMNGNSPGGVSHSFVELYNTTDEAIDLAGIGLYYADGTSVDSGAVNTATEDGPWTRISLDGKTIPAGGSLLVLGKKHTNTDSTRYIIPDNYGDINNDNFILSRRAFKVALIRSTETLTVQNPFNTDGDGKKVSGYIDMVGAANEYSGNGTGRDRIYGFELEPARNSASEAVRRIDLEDYDDNRGDFESIRYARDNGISDELLEVRKPRNSDAGAWDPFADPADPIPPPPPEGPFVEAGAQDTLARKLLILQAYGSSDSAAGVSHSFVELYNTTDAAIPLSGITLYYADGTRGLPKADKDENWNKLALTGLIPAKASYLILGPKQSSSGRYQIPEDSGDINDSDFTLGNRSFKVALIRNADTLVEQNPFNMDGNGAKAAGYIDMVGSANDPDNETNPDQILGFETAPARNSASVTVRRTSLSDTDNNGDDFESLDYRVWSAGNPDRMTAELLEVRKPRNSGDGAWDPFAEPLPPPEGTERLMILQANTYGNDNGGGGGFGKSLVELYNNTNTAIDFNTDTYYVHIGDGTTWTSAIKLVGILPARSSFLIVTTKATEVNLTPRAELPVADQEADFAIANNAFKVALLKNQATLSVDNPFSEASLSADYVDMLGVGNATGTNINGYETANASTSRPQGPRRTSLADTDNNKEDFAQVDYRGIQTGSNGMPDEELLKFWPRNTAAGPWNPMTGESL